MVIYVQQAIHVFNLVLVSLFVFFSARVLEEREVLLYCDLHGHSRKNNIFMYGCNNNYASERLLHERIFPLMLSKNVPDKVGP